MMHKVKDVVTRFLHPSFLFSSTDDSDRSKRKRSDSTTEEVNNEQKIDRTPRNDHSNERRRDSNDDEPQLTDEEDNDSRDVPSTEQQTKRRRTANYQHILTTNSHHYENERISSPTSTTDSIISSTHTTPILRRTSIEQNYSEIINRPRQHYNLPSTYRRVTSNYDPSKSPFFSVGNRTTTNSQSTETAANHLLATSLTNRSSPPVTPNKQISSTLTKPVLNQRQMFGGTYSSINSRRLPYIERLRRRTLQDCIRLDRTLNNEPLSTTTEESEPVSTSVVSKRLKVLEKECGIQCDIEMVEPSKKSQSTFPPKEFRNEALSIPTTEKIQTDSSITIIKSQPPKLTNINTMPKVLGNITPFSWPKFARAQEEYAKKYPDKCRNDAVVPSVIGKSNVNTPLMNQSQTNTTTTLKFPWSSSSSRPAESIWKCPCCTKEHSAQTASCSLCHGINPNYKKPSASQPSVSAEKVQVPPSAIITRESNISTSTTSQSDQTTTKENVVTTSSPAVTTSITSTTFPSFGTTPSAGLSLTTNENPVTTTASFSILSYGVSSVASQQNTTSTTASSSFPSFGVLPITSQQKTVTTTASPVIPSFGVPSVTSQPNTATTTASLKNSSMMAVFGLTSPLTLPSSTSTIAPRSMFGTTPLGSLTTVTTANSSTTTTVPSFGIVTTKENPLTDSRKMSFDTSSLSSDSSMATSPTNPFPVSATFQPFGSTTSIGFTTPATTSGSTPSIPFGSFGNSPLLTATTSTNTSVVATTTPIFTSASSTITTNISTTPNLFAFSTVSPSATTANQTSFSGLSTISTFPLTSTATTSSAPTFGTNGFGFAPVSTTTANNSPFGFNASSPIRPFATSAISSMGTSNITPFGSMPPFGASSMTAERPTNPAPLFNFGLTQSNTQTSSAPTTGGFAFGAASSAPPLFGANSQSTFPITSMNPSLLPSSSTVSNPFDISPSISDDNGPTLYNVGSGGLTSGSPRRVIRARRSGRP